MLITLNINFQGRSIDYPVDVFYEVSIYDLKGSLVSKTTNFKSNIDIKNLSKGSYVVKIEFLKYLVSKKIIVK